MDTKQMLKDGFTRKTVAILVHKDSYSGKEHLIVVDTPEHAKEYKTSESMRLATMWVKES